MSLKSTLQLTKIILIMVVPIETVVLQIIRQDKMDSPQEAEMLLLIPNTLLKQVL